MSLLDKIRHWFEPAPQPRGIDFSGVAPSERWRCVLGSGVGGGRLLDSVIAAEPSFHALPVDAVGIVEWLRIEVVEARSVGGRVTIEDDRWSLTLGVSENGTKRRLAAAWCLGVLSHGRVSLESEPIDFASKFASDLVMPNRWVTTRALQYGRDWDLLAGQFGVTPQTMMRRLSECGLF